MKHFQVKREQHWIWAATKIIHFRKESFNFYSSHQLLWSFFCCRQLYCQIFYICCLMAAEINVHDGTDQSQSNKICSVSMTLLQSHCTVAIVYQLFSKYSTYIRFGRLSKSPSTFLSIGSGIDPDWSRSTYIYVPFLFAAENSLEIFSRKELNFVYFEIHLGDNMLP